MARTTNAVVDRHIEALRDVDLDILRQRWRELFAIAPSPRISRDVLIRGVAFRMQEEAYGRLGKLCRRQLNKLAADLDMGVPLSQPRPAFKPGTKLIREWKGKVHEVAVAGDTYIWGGKHYRSLSQIARAITGTRWSGPRFFGLASQGGGDRPGTSND
ncbi:MAG: DUF2924 domain-containing protein [Rhizomicrobium sp.]